MTLEDIVQERYEQPIHLHAYLTIDVVDDDGEVIGVLEDMGAGDYQFRVDGNFVDVMHDPETAESYSGE